MAWSGLMGIRDQKKSLKLRPKPPSSSDNPDLILAEGSEVEIEQLKRRITRQSTREGKSSRS